MATRIFDYDVTRGLERKQTGAFGPQDAIVINWTVPIGAETTQVQFAQILSDAMLTLTFQGKRKQGMLSASFHLKNPAPGAYSAVLTADRDVHDCNVSAGVGMPRTGR